jgi:hypothetical protein
MDWSAVGAVGELIGAVAVVLSLLYVGRQVRQSNTMARAAAWQALNSSMNGWGTTMASSPELSAALAKMHFHGLRRDDATDVERIQLAYACNAILGQLDLARRLGQDGVLTEREVDEFFGPGSALFMLPYWLDLWPILRPGYSAEFGEWFERRYPELLRSQRRDGSAS